MKSATTARISMLAISAALALGLNGPAEAQNKIIRADCSPPHPHVGHSLGQPGALERALRRAKPGDTIRVNGTCEERIILDFGPLTIDGGGGAIIDGVNMPPGEEFNGLVTIDGAHGVTLTGLTVRNSQGEGILALRGASVVIENSLIENNISGIRLAQANLELRDSQISENHGTGLIAISGSTVVFLGEADFIGNAGNGVFLEGNSMGEVRGARIQIRDSGRLGLIAGLNSSLAFLEMESAVGGSLEISNSAESGIFLGASSVLFVAGENRPAGNVLIESVGNGGPGFLVVAGSQVAAPFGTARIVSSGNPVGMVLAGGSQASVSGGLKLSGNSGPGLAADGAALVQFSNWPDNPSAIRDNGGPAVVAEFGSQLSFNDVELIGPLVCDPTIITRGFTCP